MTAFQTTARQIARHATAAGLAACMTLVALLSLNHLATEQHAATVMAKTAAAQQQAQAIEAARRG